MDLDTSLPSHHPTRHPNPHHRKIELQSPLDLNYLQTNLSTAAKQKLDLHFPPSALRKQNTAARAQPATFISLDGPSPSSHPSHPSPNTAQQPPEDIEIENDPLRARVQEIVSQFLSRTWSNAAQNITINGLEASSLPNFTSTTSDSNSLFPPTNKTNTSSSNNVHDGAKQEMEGVDFTYSPYDSRLQAHLASLYGELESLTAQVSKLRREAPSLGAQKYSASLRGEMSEEEEGYDSQLRRLEKRKRKRDDDVGGGKHGQEGRLEEEKEEEDDDEVEVDSDPLNLQKTREGYYEDARRTHETALHELSRLAGLNKEAPSSSSGTGLGSGSGSAGGGGGSLMETMGKVQRARTVALVFE